MAGLDERLAAAAALVRPGLPVADVGCDHGKLTAALAVSGLYPKVIGSDLRPGPLSKARKTIEQIHCQDRVELRLGDGLSVLSPGEVGTIVLAGVSARTTWEILEAAPWVFQKEGPRLVMIPATRPAALRRWLLEKGFVLVCDRPVRAAGRWYAVIAAEYTGQPIRPTLEQCLYGETAQWPDTEGYRALERGKLRKYRIGVPEGSPLAAEIDRLLARDQEKGETQDGDGTEDL